MISETRHRLKIYNLLRSKRKLESTYQVAVKANGRKSDAWENYRAEVELLDDAITQEASNHWFNLAERLVIPLPEYGDEHWEQSPITGLFRLNRVGMAVVRSDVNRELDRRSERFWRWLAGMTGLAGALIGLVTALSNWTDI